MITLDELIKGYDYNSLTKATQRQLQELLEKWNKVRTAYGKPLIINRGYSSPDHQIKIYQDIAKQKGILFDISKVPMKSAHIFGAAADVSDPKKELQSWIKQNVKLMEEIGLWFEDFSATPTWVHGQAYAPKSGNRFFKP